MTGRPADSRCEAGAGEQGLIGELFHALNQPLTTLQISLELSLQQPRSEAEYQQTLRRALRQAREIARLTSGIRDLVQAGDPGPRRQVLSVEDFLREIAADLQPVAESKQVRLSLRGRLDGTVSMEPQRLRQALFSLLEFALDRSRAGAVAIIEAGESESESVIRLSSTAKPDLDSSHSLNWVIARRMVEAAGGTLHFDVHRGKISIELRLPLVSDLSPAGAALSH